jgi:hypothetical protein
VDHKPHAPPRQARSLPTGCYRHKGRPGCFAQIRIDGRNRYLGYFSDVEEAAKAVAKAKREARR